MGILDSGCTCSGCLKITEQQLEDARTRWNNGEREIIFKPYHYECGDGCCDEYGTKVYVNGFNLNCDGENSESVVQGLLEFLGVDNVTVEYEYDDLTS